MANGLWLFLELTKACFWKQVAYLHCFLFVFSVKSEKHVVTGKMWSNPSLSRSLCLDTGIFYGCRFRLMTHNMCFFFKFCNVQCQWYRFWDVLKLCFCFKDVGRVHQAVQQTQPNQLDLLQLGGSFHIWSWQVVGASHRLAFDYLTTACWFVGKVSKNFGDTRWDRKNDEKLMKNLRGGWLYYTVIWGFFFKKKPWKGYYEPIMNQTI